MNDKPSFEPGNQVWNRITRNREIWRVCEVVSVHDSSLKTYQNTTVIKDLKGKGVYTIHNYGWRQELMPRGVIPNTPNNTIYLINTELGQILSNRIVGEVNFQVYECSNKALSRGQLYGYIVTPGCMSELYKWHKLSGYKVWFIAPHVQELLSFLHLQLSTVLETRAALLATESKLQDTNGQSIETNVSNI